MDLFVSSSIGHVSEQDPVQDPVPSQAIASLCR